MSKAVFAYDDIVQVRADSPLLGRVGTRAWVIAVFPDRSSRPGNAFDRFPDGPVYTVEFEDGSTAEVHEAWIEEARSS